VPLPGALFGACWGTIPHIIHGIVVRKGSKIGERDWSRRPLFASRRRRYVHWLLLLVLLLAGVVLFLFPNLVSALLAPLLS
jgi:hypothetical protein